MQTVFEWVTVGVSWLVIVTGGVAVVAGLLYLLDKMLYHIMGEVQAFVVLGDFVKNRKDFKLYKKDRGAWEEKQRMARDKEHEMFKREIEETREARKKYFTAIREE